MMRIDRLEHTIQTLLAVKARDEQEGHRHFNMAAWGEAVGEVFEPCGTVCCAWGHEAQTPEAKAAGIVCKWKSMGRGAWSLVIGIQGNECTTDIPHAAANRYYAFDCYDTFERLFTADGYNEWLCSVTVEDVIANIRQLIEVGEECFATILRFELAANVLTAP